MPHILIVDDDQDVLYTARLALRSHVDEIKTVSEPRLIPKLLEENTFDVILLDMNFGPGLTSGKEGIAWLKKILKLDPQAHVVMNTAYGDIALAVDAMKEGAIDFLVKPWSKEKLIATIQAVAKLSRSQREVERLRNTQQALSEELGKGFPEIISRSNAMEKIFSTIDKVAGTDADVLILGENGTGKELVARAIHQKSKRKNAAFIKVDMGAIVENLFESELFGHVKGAFTDARDHRVGRFEIASGGTLFLDEIGNMPLPSQAKLLTALQGRNITRVGSNKSIAVNIRLLCATNKPLYEMVASEQFRQDLLYRINTVEVRLPSLRERPDDVAILATHYLSHYSDKYEKEGLRLNKRQIKKMETYDWPGNVRELQHCIERAVILSEGKNIEIADLGAPIKNVPSPTPTFNVEDMERQAIMQAIKEADGNLTKAAKLLGFGRSTLYRKMEKYGL